MANIFTNRSASRLNIFTLLMVCFGVSKADTENYPTELPNSLPLGKIETQPGKIYPPNIQGQPSSPSDVRLYRGRPNKGPHPFYMANDEDLSKARPDIPSTSLNQYFTNCDVDKRQIRSGNAESIAISPDVAIRGALGNAQTEGRQVIEIQEIRYWETYLDNAKLFVKLEEDGRRIVRWLDFRDFDPISKADDALREFKPLFPVKRKVIQVLEIQYTKDLLDIKRLRVKLEDKGKMEVCWLDYGKFQGTIGARKALMEFRGKT